MKPKPAGHRQSKTLVLSFLLFFFSLFYSPSAITQELTAQIRAKLEVVTNYLSAANDNTNFYLEQLNYHRPAAITAGEWNAFPAIRKIETAYKAAAANNQGNEFIEALSKLIAQDYNSIKSEHLLSHVFTNTGIPSIKFSHPEQLSDLEKITVPPSIKNEILTVGKYVDEGALGSLQSVMKNYLNLDDAVVYELIIRSPNNQVALEQGLLRSAVPPPHEARLAHMATDMQAFYKALQSDARLSEVAHRPSNPSYSYLDDRIKPDDLPPPIAPGPNVPHGSGGGGGGINFEEFRQHYKSSYAKHANYESFNYKGHSKGFKNMVHFRGGFGGVILGDSILVDPKLKPVDIRWRPINDTVHQDYKKIGYLEVRFKDSTGYQLFGPVLYEDVFAAHMIVNDTGYHYGNGIGMVSIIDNSNISFSNGAKRFGINLHPAVSHLRLGWAFVIADALAISRNSLEKAVAGDTTTRLLDQFFLENNTTWKVSDKQIRITPEGGHLVMEPIVLTMWGFRGYEEIPTRSTIFEKLLPLICSNVEEYKRVNEFAKVLTLFRWAKGTNSTFSNITTYNSFIRQPVCIHVNDKGELQFNTRQEDRDLIRSEKELYQTILDSSRNDKDAAYARKINSLRTWFTSMVASREKWWSAPVNTNGEQVAAGLDTEDSTGFAIIKDISRTYSRKWLAKCVQLTNPDSAGYYVKLYDRVSPTITLIRHFERKIDSLRNLGYAIMNKYHYNPLMPASKLPPQASSKLQELYSQMFTYTLNFKRYWNSPTGKAAQKDYLTLKMFELRNRVLTPEGLSLLMLSEKKAIRDYFE